MSNSHGNTDRALRKWLRQMGLKTSVANVELIGKEVRRTESQNDQVDSIGREQARARGESGLYDKKGDAIARRKRAMKKHLKERDG